MSSAVDRAQARLTHRRGGGRGLAGLLAGVLAAAGLSAAGVLAAAAPAGAVVTPLDGTGAENILVFPERDFVSLTGFPTTPLTVRVVRAGVVIGSAHGTPVLDPAAGESLIEVNHPGGVCWDGVTPDLLPGDVVQVITDDSNPLDPVGRSATTRNVSTDFAQPADLDGDAVPDDVLVHGRAVDLATGGPVPLADLEQRIIQPALVPINGKRSLRAPGDGTLVYDPVDPVTNPDGTRWTATYLNLGAAATAAATDTASSETRILSWQAADAAGTFFGITIFEVGSAVAGGPGFPGCPNAAADVVTASTPSVVNLAGSAAPTLVLNGTAFNPLDGTVTVDDADLDHADAITVPVTVNGPASTDPAVTLPWLRTWTAAVPMASVLALDDGDLTVTPAFTRVLGTLAPGGLTRQTASLTGAGLARVKDTVAPAAPALTPDPGQYFASQTVHANPADETDVVRYRVATGTAATPTSLSPVFPAAGLLVGTSTQVAAVAVDIAGNPSPLTRATYTISAPRAPDAPTGLLGATVGTRVDLSWTAPAVNGGAAVSGYRVLGGAPGGIPVDSFVTATSTSLSGLTPGATYTFTVAARNVHGDSVPSAPVIVPVPGVPSAPLSPTVTRGNGSLTVSWGAPLSDGGLPLSGYQVGISPAVALPGGGATAGASITITGVSNATAYTVTVAARNQAGLSPTAQVTAAPATAAGAPGIGVPTVTFPVAPATTATATVRWTAPASTGGLPVTGYQVDVVTPTGTLQRPTITVGAVLSTAVTGLPPGVPYRFRVRAVTGAGVGPSSALSVTIPNAPAVSTTNGAKPGTTGGAVTASVTWGAPATGVSAITGYRVFALRMSAAGAVLSTTASSVQPATARTLSMTLAAGSYRFQVIAVNAVGISARSARSNLVAAR
jgi:hypothetical protein